MSEANQSKFASSISRFGEATKRKLANPAATGEPEDQLRGPLENLFGELAELAGIPPKGLGLVGESSISDLKTRPDYAVTVRGALCGFIEVKAPGKGADPRRFRDRHDKEQWNKLKAIPNLLYTDGNEFALWRDGQLSSGVVRCEGDVVSSGSDLSMPATLLALVEDFLRWQPVPPRTAKERAVISARLCRLLRDEVAEQLALGTPGLTDLAEDWRRLLFPEATDAVFADGYAQAVTFGLLMARAREIELSPGLVGVARELSQTDSLIGTALRLLTDSEENQSVLQTSLGTLSRVLNVVSWDTLSKGDSDAWLYFYEDFLDVYDRKLRKQTGSYYTPPEVVEGMIGLVDECLRTRFDRARGLAAHDVTIADPAVGTGTFLLGLLRKISKTVSDMEGPGAIPAALGESVRRLIAFELQLGPFRNLSTIVRHG
ncbi:MAG TPA: N-6 DNA methylase [Gemmatimonadales bacterium]|nr:N-6 DNA methylase [Gemmatimonadales bacterium]